MKSISDLTVGCNIKAAYVRVCMDSGYQIDMVMASKITGGMFGITALEVYLRFGDIKTMESIAKGSHPVCKLIKQDHF